MTLQHLKINLNEKQNTTYHVNINPLLGILHNLVLGCGVDILGLTRIMRESVTEHG
jgi:hypothetical protein